MSPSPPASIARPRISDLARALTPEAGAQVPGSAHAPTYLNGLNSEQRAAVETLDGPLLVLAGAGTGKTRVLTTRLAHLVGTGRARPWEILSVTFTNKAAREMRERALHLLGPTGEGLRWLGTFHSIAATMLRRHAELAGLKSSFTILDTDDQLRLVKQILEAEGVDTKRWTPRYLASLIDNWKNKALTPARITSQDDHSFADGRGRALYQIYQDRLKVLNACDFGDLLLHMIDIFQAHPDLLAEYHGKLRYLLVDEYQDTNVAQYLWLRLLARGHNNLCVVGDDDQSIYGWRGAEVDNILRFEKDFAGAKVIRLERNYRSTGHILGAAAHLIATNSARLGKTLWTEDEAGDQVRVRGVWDGDSEARLVADEIEAWVAKGRRNAECAVLVRASWQMRAFEERFILLGIPYKVIGGPRFFERAEIRDAMAYLRLIRSPSDDLAFERVVNEPKRGVGDTSLKKVQIIARDRGQSLDAAARHLLGSDELRGGARTGLRQFVDALDRWRREAENLPHTQLAELILDESGYTDMLRAERSPQAQTRLDNLKELVRAMGEFDSLASFLEHVELVMDAAGGETGDEVQILTLHAAKGLEWPMVFLPGWEEEVFPSRRSLDESGQKGLEEERRLAYVGITRARERAFISFAANRQIYGKWQSVLPSRFVDELDPAHVEALSDTGYQTPGMMGGNGGQAGGFHDVADPFRSSYQSPGWQRFQAANARGQGYARAPVIDGKAELVATATSEGRYRVGQRVFHEKFGYGRVSLVEGNKLTVAFEKAGEKRVIDSFVKAT
jgi:DNA helicase-2/ATP-dependent DNA helicase PcrA